MVAEYVFSYLQIEIPTWLMFRGICFLSGLTAATREGMWILESLFLSFFFFIFSVGLSLQHFRVILLRETKITSSLNKKESRWFWNFIRLENVSRRDEVFFLSVISRVTILTFYYFFYFIYYFTIGEGYHDVSQYGRWIQGGEVVMNCLSRGVEYAL